MNAQALFYVSEIVSTLYKNALLIFTYTYKKNSNKFVIFEDSLILTTFKIADFDSRKQVT